MERCHPSIATKQNEKERDDEKKKEKKNNDRPLSCSNMQNTGSVPPYRGTHAKAKQE